MLFGVAQPLLVTRTPPLAKIRRRRAQEALPISLRQRMAPMTHEHPDGFDSPWYERERWGCSLRFRFPMVKLLDWRDRAAVLEADRNPFALVALAQLQAMAHRGPARKRVKIRLIRFLYARDS
jgi:hypothetical protein